jgi:RimJ/RimL family protein N-acetyltransferase
MQERPSPSPVATAGGEWLGESSHRLPTLRTARLRLRWLETDDLEPLYRLYSDRESMRWTPHTPLASAEDASIQLEEAHRGLRQGDRLQWGVERLETRGVIGTALLADVDLAQGHAQMRLLLDNRFRGQGYGRETGVALLAHAFNELGLRRVEAEIAAGNQPSLKTFEALGFKREGYLRQRRVVGTAIHDCVLLALLASEFDKQ